MAQVEEPLTVEADTRLTSLRRIAVVPAYNEEHSVAAVIAEIRAADPEMAIVVVDDGSRDATQSVAQRAGATVLSLPFNVGIGAAVQAGYQYALEHGFDVAVQVDGDGQHDASELGRLLEPIADGSADMVVGTRFSGKHSHRPPPSRRIGIWIFARFVSMIVRETVTDTTSGFRAVNRKVIRLFAADYPNDYPEVEATVLAYRYRLRVAEVPVRMRDRHSGRSSITPIRSVYYVVKVSLALLVGLFRTSRTTVEEEK